MKLRIHNTGNLKWFLVPIVAILAGIILRMVNLGYADYQGDEIKAFYLPEPGHSIAEFLFTQRKGPLQFMITGILTLVDPLYENQFLMRVFLRACRMPGSDIFLFTGSFTFWKRIGVYSTFFMATNGILVGLSRIAQYQSYVILGGLLALFFFNKAAKDPSYKISGVIWVLRAGRWQSWPIMMHC